MATLLNSAKEDGTLSPAGAGAINIADIGEQIQMGIGVDVDDVKASEVTLVTMMPDDSGSIRFAGNAQHVRDGHNLVLDSLGGSKQKDGILVHCRYLNGFVLYPFAPLDQVVRMDSHNYDPSKGTPLYDQSVVLLGTVLAKVQSFEDNGVPCRAVTLIITDGADEHSRQQNPSSVRAIVRDMLKTEGHIIAGMGIDDGGSTDFRRVFSEMGIEDEWILTPGNTPSELRRAFNVFSQSAVRASQGGASFSQTAAGGFGN
ncbi:MAG: hypothetical protein HY452_01125 [Parcubacteria group bacterium]|nr:hypothetical protein [Parcubacteria group bacterium]